MTFKNFVDGSWVAGSSESENINTSNVDDTAYRSIKNEGWLDENGYIGLVSAHCSAVPLP